MDIGVREEMRHSIKDLLSVFLMGLAMMIVSATAQAYIFVLEDVTFSDGGTVVGFFEFAGDWHINVSGGDVDRFPEFDYKPSTSEIFPVQDIAGLTFLLGATGTDRSLRLLLPDPQNAGVRSGDVLPLITVDAVHLRWSEEATGVLEYRSITGGRALVSCGTECSPSQGVPEPSGFVFLAAGIAIGIARLAKHSKRHGITSLR